MASAAGAFDGDDFSGVALDAQRDGAAADGAVLDSGVAALRGVGGARKYFAAIRALDFDFDDVIHALFELQAWRVIPQVFEAVEFAFAWVEEVHNHAAEIHDDPLAEREAVHAERADAVLLSHGVGDFAGDGL